MRSISEVVGEATADSPTDHECYRCDREVGADQLFRLSIQPPEVLSDRYARSTRWCCPDCVAGMGLQEFKNR